MKTNFRLLWVPFVAVLSVAFFFACQKDVSGNDGSVPAGKQKLSIYLADGPTDYQQVLVDIQQIAVKLDTCARNGDDDHDGPGCDDDHDSMHHCEYWDTLDIRPGVYDLLTLRNGVDTLLATGFTLPGKVVRIKVTLGNNNSVLVDSVSHPLNLVNHQNFIFVNIHREHLDSLTSNNFQLYLDFDLSRSIRYFNGQYWLRPVLLPFGRHSTGEIEGKVRPVHSYGMIKAYNGTDTGYARPFDQGEFKIRGLREGTYSVFIDGVNGYQDTTISNIIVTRNHDVKLGTIQLHQ